MSAGSARLAAAAVGIAVWTAITVASGRTEAWDTGLYWSLGLPVIYIACGVLGYASPAGSFSLGAAAVLSQVVPLIVVNPSDASLLPLGVIFLVVLSLPASACAWIGRRIRRLGSG